MTIEFGQGPATQGQLGKGNHASVERTKHEIKARGHSQTGGGSYCDVPALMRLTWLPPPCLLNPSNKIPLTNYLNTVPFIFTFETWSCYVTQAGLKPVASGLCQ